MMKALSIRQPFAELILSGRKTIELRSWNTKFRGRFLVHAGQTAQKKRLEQYGYQKLPTGFLLGEVTLQDVIIYTSRKQFEQDADKHQASGRVTSFPYYGFVLSFPLRIKPVQYKGQLGFFDVDNAALQQ